MRTKLCQKQNNLFVYYFFCLFVCIFLPVFGELKTFNLPAHILFSDREFDTGASFGRNIVDVHHPISESRRPTVVA